LGIRGGGRRIEKRTKTMTKKAKKEPMMRVFFW
jgi:hypothetical protein